MEVQLLSLSDNIMIERKLKILPLSDNITIERKLKLLGNSQYLLGGGPVQKAKGHILFSN